jgi:hypothetical protein
MVGMENGSTRGGDMAGHGRCEVVPELGHVKIAGKGQVQDGLAPGEDGDRP